MQNYSNLQERNSYMYQSSDEESTTNDENKRIIARISSSTNGNDESTTEDGNYDDLNSNFSKYMSRVKHLELNNHILEKNMEESRMDWDDEISRMSREKSTEFDSCRQALQDNYLAICEIKGEITKTYLSCERIQSCLDFESNINESALEKVTNMSKFNSSLLEEINQLTSNICQKQNEIITLKEDYSKNNCHLEEIEIEFADCNCKRNYLEIELQVLKNIVQCMVAVFNVKSREYDNVLGCLLEPTQFYRSELTRAISKTRRDFTKLDQLQLMEMEDYYNTSLMETQQSLDLSARRLEELQNNEDSEKHNAVDVSNLMENVKHLNEMKIELERDKAKLSSFECKLHNQIKQNTSMRKSTDEHYKLKIDTLHQQIEDIKLEISKVRDDNVSLKMELNVCKTLQQDESSCSDKLNKLRLNSSEPASKKVHSIRDKYTNKDDKVASPPKEFKQKTLFISHDTSFNDIDNSNHYHHHHHNNNRASLSPSKQVTSISSVKLKCIGPREILIKNIGTGEIDLKGMHICILDENGECHEIFRFTEDTSRYLKSAKFFRLLLIDTHSDQYDNKLKENKVDELEEKEGALHEFTFVVDNLKNWLQHSNSQISEFILYDKHGNPVESVRAIKDKIDNV